MIFLRIDFVVDKNNLRVGEYEVFGLVSYRKSNIEVAFNATIEFVFECCDRRRGFCFLRYLALEKANSIVVN